MMNPWAVNRWAAPAIVFALVSLAWVGCTTLVDLGPPNPLPPDGAAPDDTAGDAGDSGAGDGDAVSDPG